MCSQYAQAMGVRNDRAPESNHGIGLGQALCPAMDRRGVGQRAGYGTHGDKLHVPS